MPAKFGLFVDEDHSKLPTLYWLPKLHKRPYKSRFIANSSACTTTELSILLTSCLTAIKNHVIKYWITVYERNGKNLFWSIKNSGEILNKLKSRGFLESSLSTYDFSTLYTKLTHNLIKEKLTELIEQTFNREGSLYLACNDKNAFFTSEQPKRYKLRSLGALLNFIWGLLFEKTYLIVIKDETDLKSKLNASTLILIGSYVRKLVASYLKRGR